MIKPVSLGLNASINNFECTSDYDRLHKSKSTTVCSSVHERILGFDFKVLILSA